MGMAVRGARTPFGLIVNDTSGAATTYHQVGGEGVCQWKTLFNGGHLVGDWNIVEHLTIEPGGSVGEHVHTRTEEIYYILRGEAEMHMNGVPFTAREGDLITTPIGAAHSIANRTEQDMQFFVVEVFPQDGPAAETATVNVPSLLARSRRRAVVDLRPYFTGDWRTFSLVEVPDGGTAVRETPDENTEVLYVVKGTAEFEVDGRRYTGGPGRCFAIQPHLDWKATARGPLILISTEVGVR